MCILPECSMSYYIIYICSPFLFKNQFKSKFFCNLTSSLFSHLVASLYYVIYCIKLPFFFLSSSCTRGFVRSIPSFSCASPCQSPWFFKGNVSCRCNDLPSCLLPPLLDQGRKSQLPSPNFYSKETRRSVWNSCSLVNPNP